MAFPFPFRRLLWAFACAGLLPAQPLRIVAVIRKGLPPYEAGTQTYRLDGGDPRQLRVGQVLRVRRPGDPRALGWLQVTSVGPGPIEARLFRPGATYLLKGDEAWPAPLPSLPHLPRPDSLPPTPGAPLPGATPPPREEVLFFLPHREDLSPAGRRKLAEWAGDWAAWGRWTIQVPTSRAVPADLQRRREATLRLHLAALGVTRVDLDEHPRSAAGPYDPAWIRCQE